MERLTKINEHRTAHFYQQCFEKCGGIGYSRKCDDCDLLDKVCDKLGEYEDLEEQGKLLKLPAAVGDTVYEVQDIRKRIQSYTITSASIGRGGEWFFGWALKDGQGFYGRIDGFPESYLGVKVFLTREEAEAALKEL